MEFDQESPNNKEKERCLNILIVGDQKVGKTALITKHVTKEYNPKDSVATLGLDFKSSSFQSPDDKNVEVKIWDTSGQERFRSLVTGFYKKAHGIIIVYDVA